jgi:hypothetical protein
MSWEEGFWICTDYGQVNPRKFTEMKNSHPYENPNFQGCTGGGLFLLAALGEPGHRHEVVLLHHLLQLAVVHLLDDRVRLRHPHLVQQDQYQTK